MLNYCKLGSFFTDTNPSLTSVVRLSPQFHHFQVSSVNVGVFNTFREQSFNHLEKIILQIFFTLPFQIAWHVKHDITGSLMSELDLFIWNLSKNLKFTLLNIINVFLLSLKNGDFLSCYCAMIVHGSTSIAFLISSESGTSTPDSFFLSLVFLVGSDPV